jgi:hypothetical protein
MPKNDEIKHIDSLFEFLAYVVKKMFGALGSWKTTLRLILVLIAAIGAGYVIKYLVKVFG